MSDLKAERREAARAERAEQRAAHFAGSYWTYLAALAAALVVALALHNGVVPGLEWSHWAHFVAVFAMLIGILLMWLAELTRPA